MKIYNYFLKTITEKGAAFFVLVDPDKIYPGKLPDFLSCCNKAGIDGLLIGGSLLMQDGFENYIKRVKEKTSLPVIIFPGSINQVNKSADAILFLSVISGRNPEHLIGKHVLSAPLIKQSGIEPISTGYMLVESGAITTALYMSGSNPIPRNKPEIAAATALAAEYLGMKLVYLEAGSGADMTVPNEMIKAVSHTCSIPVIVGGGIRTPSAAREKVEHGAKIIVAGNFFENENNWELMKDFADAVHVKSYIAV
ncbi:MAG: geranylgeranylglyceryl/heptaprenylglyceryl phosphate synthase [Ignavibacteriaceae bacterium]